MDLPFRNWCLHQMGQQLLQNILHPPRNTHTHTENVYGRQYDIGIAFSLNVLACVTCSVPNLPNEKLALDQASQTLNNHTKFGRFEVSWIETPRMSSVEVCCIWREKIIIACSIWSRVQPLLLEWSRLWRFVECSVEPSVIPTWVIRTIDKEYSANTLKPVQRS